MATYKLILMSFEDTLYGVWLLHEITSKCSLHQNFIHPYLSMTVLIHVNQEVVCYWIKKKSHSSKDNRWAGIFPKGIAWGVGPKVLVTHSLKAFFCHIKWNTRMCAEDRMTIWWVPSVWHKVTPPLKNAGYPLSPSLPPASLVFRPFTAKWFSYSCMVGSG